MSNSPWQLEEPIDAIVFDCDSTLSQIEGIDALAEKNGVLSKVHRLTEEAMSETGVFADMYRVRLDLVKPTRDEMFWLGERYYQNRTEHIEHAIQILHDLGKSVHIASAGLRQAIKPFAKRLHIPDDKVDAVNVSFNEDGTYKGYQTDSLLIENKEQIVANLKEKYPRIVHVGDGMNDVGAAEVATRFIGYGGRNYRPNVARLSDYYVLCQSALAFLPLLLTQQEADSLTNSEAACYKQGLELLQHGEVEGCDLAT